MAEANDAVEQPGIVQKRHGACHVFTLDRSATYNALDAGMIATLAASYKVLARDPNLYVVILKSAHPKAFSAGGDVRALLALAKTNQAAAQAWLAGEYAFNWLHECFSKPTVALIDGIVMGSGVGISAYATHRVAGAGYKFAMPETAIGFFPDVGVAHGLARLPRGIGLYLGLTGATIGRADAYELGLVTHVIDAHHYAAIEEALADCQPVDQVLDKLHADPGPAALTANAQTIARCFATPDVGQIMAALQAETGEGEAFARQTLSTLQKRSPLALAVTARHISEARGLDLRLTLEQDYRLACRYLTQPDFREGVRAVLVDKDQSPRWHPAALADVTPDILDDMFATMPGRELELPLRQEMQAMRV
jgi:enoyl-CoA hydratase